jgi:D-alanyl-D-alanine carboxypeptidase (penicillin-binding protein 5/6)
VRLATVLAVILTVAPAALAVTSGSRPTPFPLLSEAPFPVAAKAAVLMDAGSGQVLMAKCPNEARPLASLTKVMTLRLVGQALADGKLSPSLEIEVPGEVADLPDDSSTMRLRPGERVTVESLLYGAAVGSANDACLSLAQAVSGSAVEFVDLMNREAAALKLGSARFVDPHGLSPGNVMSALDAARLARFHLRQAGGLMSYHAVREYTFRGYRMRSHNGLLESYRGAGGLKTGHTTEAGFNLIATAERDGLTLIVVLLGSPEEAPADFPEAGIVGADGPSPLDPDERAEAFRDRTAAAILDWGFGAFVGYGLGGAGSRAGRGGSGGPGEEDKRGAIAAWLPVFGGRQDRAPIGLIEPVMVAVPRGREGDVRLDFALSSGYLKAPVAQGLRLGWLTITLDGAEIDRVAVETLFAVERGTPIDRAWGWLGLVWARLAGPPSPTPYGTP